ncbi:phosphoribosyltransferase family protein [Agathobaculum sp. NTUH-O15-33]|uniref:ComF family protein n=1 Tax=Agathobaculum sp. NTUH-O15-33 TaxID=3079302 RepID=UPI002958A8AA|nr:phosphoribosyltransferase family protein [Agathobaculum sp. NTUH-O15-33]WNX83570.1 phosphoribosyltransferase family protein [Agathobaculum sp. NTUH-O15-33]
MGVIYPKKCILCGETLPLAGTGAALLCPDCARAVRRDYRETSGVRIPDTDGAVASLRYTGRVAEAMKRFKFSHYQHYAPWFAAQLTAALTAYLDAWQPDLVTFIPIGLVRWYQRGYNQSELIAADVAGQLGLPLVPLLKKRRFVRKQSARQGKAARTQNIKHAFLPMPDHDLTGKNVLLIDDIITTGATLSAAADTLRAMGAARVYAAAPTVARHK